MRNHRLIGATAVAALGLTSAVAFAAPARNATLTAAAPSFAWEDGPRNSAGTEGGNPADLAGQPCNDHAYPCDDTLIKVAESGTLTLVTDGDDGANANTRPDMDLYLYASDDKGTEGKLLKASETPAPDEKVIHKAAPGFYLVRNKYFSGVQVSYKGTATLTGMSAAPAPAPGSGTGGGTGTPAPATPSKLTVAASLGATSLSKVAKTGFPVKVSCSAACKGTVALAISAKDAKKLKIKGGKLGTAGFTHEGDKVFAVKVSGAVAKKLKKAKSLSVTLSGTATDASGGQSTPLAAKAKFKK